MNCHNGAKYLQDAISSVFSQTFPDWEIIFWDNSSSDNSAEIAKSFGDRIRYFRSENKLTLGSARKRALEQSSADWIAFLDVDDLWFPEKLELQLEEVSKGDYGICYGGVEVINLDGNKIGVSLPRYESGYQLGKQLKRFEINMVTPILSRHYLEKYNLQFDDRIVASEEYNLFMKLLAKADACVIPRTLGVVRISENSLTSHATEHWYKDRILTLNDIVEDDSSLKIKYESEFDMAYSQGIYYKACWLMKKKDFKAARNALRSISRKSFRYRVFYYCSYIPFIWYLLHNRAIKKRLEQIFGKYVYRF